MASSLSKRVLVHRLPSLVLSICFQTGPSVVCLSPCHRVYCAEQAVIDTGKLAPYDVLMPDEELAPEEVKQIQLAASMWTASGYYHLLPWSCVVLESVPEAEVGVGGKVALAVQGWVGSVE